MARTELCPGSVRATAGLPEIPSPYAEDGTEAHDVLAYALKNGIRKAHEAYTLGLSFGHVKQWTHRADEYKERCASIDMALDETYDILDKNPDAVLHVETRVLFPSQHTRDAWGTSDIIILIPSKRLVYVLDFKHGSGTAVDAKDNLQIGMYGVAALSTYNVWQDYDTVVLGIIQPRAFHAQGPVRMDTKHVSYLSNEMYPRIERAIAASQAPDAPLVPGDKQCQFCPLKANCPAREAAALAVVGANFASVKDVTVAALPLPSQLPADRLAYIKQAATVLRGWLKDVDEAAEAIARAGGYVPGFKLVETAPRRVYYQNDEMTAYNLMSLTGADIDTVYPRQLIGITEAEKLVVDAFKENVKRGRKKAAAEDAKNAFALLTTKQSSGNLTLVPESDPRPAVNVAQKAFANVKVI